jgi:uncharacterized membrane protein (DUF2068 family)
MPEPAPHRHHGAPLLLIGAFKLFKAALLISVGIGALRLLHRDVAEQLSDWISEIRIDPHSRYFYGAIQKLGMLDDHKLREISFGSFFYASLLLIEGIGLCLRKRWAEFFTVGMTMSLIPLEVYEIYRRATTIRVALLLVNLAIVWYLIALLRRDRHTAQDEATAPTPAENAVPRTDASAATVRVTDTVPTSGAVKPPKTQNKQGGQRGQSSSHTVR